MKTTVKKFISVLLVSLMLLTTAPLSGFVGLELPEIPWTEIFTTKAGAAANGICRTNLTWTLDDEGTLTITGAGAMTNYSYSSVPWYQNRNSVKKVIIEKGVKSIGNSAFFRCSSLTAIKIPEGVTLIGDDAFCYCTSLTAIKIPEGVTSIGNTAFFGCSSLTAIEIPEGVTTIDNFAFERCTSLTAIEIPEGVTLIGAFAFAGCSSLTAIEIPEGVTLIGDYAFAGCSSLTDVYYGGTEEQWNNIVISIPTPITNAEKHFNFKYTLGDIDNDNETSSADARIALRASVGLEELSFEEKKAADVDKDFIITSADARTILRVSVGLEEL
ncbi:MAG: leucine-rich repeat protein [Clostridia bacterium]|nr:leucine-rich repeat protein [Clostridia bacterium]